MSTTTWNSDLLSNGSIFSTHQPERRQRQRDARSAPRRPAPSSARLRAPRRIVEQRAEDALEERARACAARPLRPRARSRPSALRLQPQPREPRRDDEGDRQRQQHAHARVDRDRAHVRPHQAGDEGHRQQRGDHRQRREDGRAADFVDRAGDELGERLVRVAAPGGGGCSRPPRSRRRPGCRSRRSARTATRGSA